MVINVKQILQIILKHQLPHHETWGKSKDAPEIKASISKELYKQPLKC
jgi:hypothetical protein